MKRLLLAALLVGGVLGAVHPAAAIDCSLGAYKPTAYGVAQVRGVGDVDCAGNYDTISILVWVSVDSKVLTPPANNHLCHDVAYCSESKIKTRTAGWHCYYTGVDATLWSYSGTRYDMTTLYSVAFCTTY